MPRRHVLFPSKNGLVAKFSHMPRKGGYVNRGQVVNPRDVNRADHPRELDLPTLAPSRLTETLLS